MRLSDEWPYKVVIFVRSKVLQSTNILCVRVFVVFPSKVSSRGGRTCALRSSKLIAIFSKRLFCYFREIQYAFRIRLFWETLVNGTLKERPGSFKYT